MAWIQLMLYTSAEKAEFVSDCLHKAGALSVTFEDAKDTPIFEPDVHTTPLWNDTKVIGLFEDSVDLVSVKKFLSLHLEASVFNTLYSEPLAEKNWTRAWMEHFHPIQFGERLWICPTWCEIPNKNAINIILDPGMAFGTGTHETTALCLEWLDAHPPKNAVIIDYGCGSGILGIAAVKLGAKKVYAVDHDPQALESTKANAEKNGLTTKQIIPMSPKTFQEIFLNETKQAAPIVHLILANILANPLLELAPTFAKVLQKNGTIVLSGILEIQQEKIIACYSEWFTTEQIFSKNDWVRISAIRQL